MQVSRLAGGALFNRFGLHTGLQTNNTAPARLEQSCRLLCRWRAHSRDSLLARASFTSGYEVRMKGPVTSSQDAAQSGLYLENECA
jgi:hypothetical protein